MNWKVYKKLKFDQTVRWYMYKTESVLENEKHKILWDFEIQRDHLISSRKLDLTIVNKERKTWRISYFAVLADQRTKIKENNNKKKKQKKTNTCTL